MLVGGSKRKEGRLHQTSPSDQTPSEQRATPEQRALVYQALENEDTYNRLYRGITLWVFRLTDARTREEAHAQAEDILQEAVVQAFTKLDTYDPARPA
jgi:hypothetical protein